MYSIPEEPAPPNPSVNSPVYELQTERLLLRRVQESDLELFHEILSNHDAMTYLSGAPHTDISQTTNAILDIISNGSCSSSDYFALCLKSPSSTSRFIGKIGVFENEVSYILHPSCWRKGIASEAMKAFLEYFWETWPDVGGLKADVDPRNTASLRLLVKFGFVEIGRKENTYETHLWWCGSVYLRLGRPE